MPGRTTRLPSRGSRRSRGGMWGHRARKLLARATRKCGPRQQQRLAFLDHPHPPCHSAPQQPSRGQVRIAWRGALREHQQLECRPGRSSTGNVQYLWPRRGLLGCLPTGTGQWYVRGRVCLSNRRCSAPGKSASPLSTIQARRGLPKESYYMDLHQSGRSQHT